MQAIIRLFFLCSLFSLVACSKAPTNTEPDYHVNYDLYISGGRIVDGTGAAPYEGDILVKDGKIAFIGQAQGQKIKASQTITVDSNNIITPGFIDAHSHGNPLADNNGFMRSFLRQGVTTIILGQDGTSPFTPLDEWMDNVEAHGTSVNIAALIGHGSIRTLSGAGEKDKVSPTEQANMEKLLAEGMEQGAFGLSTGLEYLPGRYADRHELNGLAKIVGKYDGLISSHIRNEDDDKIMASLDEVLDQAEFAKVNVTHIKVVYGKTREQGDAVLARIRAARDSGKTVTADVYPYLASFGSMIYLYPEWAKREIEFNEAAAHRREEFESFLRAKIKRRNGPGAILVSSGEYAGKTLLEISKITNKRPEELVIDFGHRGPSTAHFIMTKATQDAFITAPDVSISTDGSPTMRHPRSFGSFPKVIEEYVVRDELLSIEEAVYKMSGLTANTFGIKSRGVLKAGLAADILVLNLDTLKANTGWSNINAVPSGIELVIVNGHLTETTPTSPTKVYGKVLRKNLEH